MANSIWVTFSRTRIHNKLSNVVAIAAIYSSICICVCMCRFCRLYLFLPLSFSLYMYIVIGCA